MQEITSFHQHVALFISFGENARFARTL